MNPPPRSRSAPRLPSETTRAVVTAALALYLVGLALSVFGNSGSGGSALVTTIKSRLFAPWMVPTWLDLGFDYRLTHGYDDDADHALVVRRHDDPRGAAAIRLPQGMAGERAARWRRLARAAAATSDDADRDTLLPTAIARGLFDDLGGDDVLVRVVRMPLAERDGAAAPGPAQASAARVRMVGGEMQLIRQEARGEVAPLAPRPAAETAEEPAP